MVQAQVEGLGDICGPGQRDVPGRQARRQHRRVRVIPWTGRSTPSAPRRGPFAPPTRTGAGGLGRFTAFANTLINNSTLAGGSSLVRAVLDTGPHRHLHPSGVQNTRTISYSFTATEPATRSSSTGAPSTCPQWAFHVSRARRTPSPASATADTPSSSRRATSTTRGTREYHDFTVDHGPDREDAATSHRPCNHRPGASSTSPSTSRASTPRPSRSLWAGDLWRDAGGGGSAPIPPGPRSPRAPPSSLVIGTP